MPRKTLTPQELADLLAEEGVSIYEFHIDAMYTQLPNGDYDLDAVMDWLYGEG